MSTTEMEDVTVFGVVVIIIAIVRRPRTHYKWWGIQIIAFMDGIGWPTIYGGADPVLGVWMASGCGQLGSFACISVSVVEAWM